MLVPLKREAQLGKVYIALIRSKLPILRTTLLREGFLRYGSRRARRDWSSAERDRAEYTIMLARLNAGLSWAKPTLLS